MKKKAILLRCVKLLCLVLCVALLSGVAQDFCRYYDYNVTKLAGFYAEPENTLDVVFLGASEVFTGFSSTYAYDLYGFTSYPYCQDASSAALYISQLKEVLKHQNPEWIVMEINGALYEDPEMLTDSGGMRRYLNNIPFSWNKVQTITQLVPQEDWYFYFFPLAKNHSNWKNAGNQGQNIRDYYAIRRSGSLLKGNVLTVTDYKAPASRAVAGDLSTAPLEPQAEVCLRGFLEYCRDEGIDNILFVRFPHIIANDALYTRFQRGNRAGEIIQEYGYPFVNLERDNEEIGLDYSSDFYNEDHLDLSGQKKLTEYLGKLLKEEYGVEGRSLTEKQWDQWGRAADYGRAFYELCQEHTQNNVHGFFYETGELVEQLKDRLRTQP